MARHMRSHLALAFAIAVAISMQIAAADRDPAPKRVERDQVARFHMHQSFDLVRAIERLLLRGKLEEAKRFAEAIALAPDAPAHGAWAAQTLAVRDRALALSKATSVDDALRRATKLAAACGDCHRDTYGSTMFDQPPPVPPDRPAIDARMVRHRWAADRLWEAVVGDSDVAWREGLDVLAATPLDFGADRASFARDLQRLANTARRTKAPAAGTRAAAYAELLVTCAGCHLKETR
jgi:cytochrome c553